MWFLFVFVKGDIAFLCFLFYCLWVFLVFGCFYGFLMRCADRANKSQHCKIIFRECMLGCCYACMMPVYCDMILL